MTKDEIARGLRICGKKMGCGHCPGKGLQDPLGERLCTELLMLRAAALIEQQDARIAGLEAKVPRWIPVTERLPENGVPVLVNYIGNNYGKYHPDAIAVWTDYGCFWWEGSLEDCYAEVAMPITHWMPLPGWPEDET